MTLLDNVMGTMNTAVDTISTIARDIVEKNRTNAKLNRLRLVMKSESELMNRAYIALGKAEYDTRKKGETPDNAECEKLIRVIDSSKAKIAKARECYRKIVDSTNDIFYGMTDDIKDIKLKSGDIVDITVACSNENEYSSSPFDGDVPEQPAETENEPEVKAESQKAATINDLKTELEKRKAESIADEDNDQADDTEAPRGELF